MTFTKVHISVTILPFLCQSQENNAHNTSCQWLLLTRSKYCSIFIPARLSPSAPYPIGLLPSPQDQITILGVSLRKVFNNYIFLNYLIESPY